MKMDTVRNDRSVFFRLLFIVVLTSGFYWPETNAQSIQTQDRAMIRPSIMHLKPGAQQQFKIILKATRMNAASNPKEVKWSVNDVLGGSKEYGTINTEGVYQAPNKIPSPREYILVALLKKRKIKFFMRQL